MTRPVAILVLAASLLLAPRAHRGARSRPEHGAERYAEHLLDTCDTVALAIASEHLGAREYLAVPRDDGPGRRLEASGFPEFLGMFMTPSQALALRDLIAGVQSMSRETIAGGPACVPPSAHTGE